MKPITAQPAETMEQAPTWENTRNGYAALGLCDKCAAQAAWGHQQHAGGWNSLHPPCVACAPIVAGFESPTTDAAWRKNRRAALRGAKHAERDSAALTAAPGGRNGYLSALPKPAWIGCGGCDSRWTGLIAAHCARCHLSFTSVSAFDTHRRDGKCLDPATTFTRNGEPAFVPADRDWPGWSLPGTWDGPQ